jgi:hypothetical protein
MSFPPTIAITKPPSNREATHSLWVGFWAYTDAANGYILDADTKAQLSAGSIFLPLDINEKSGLPVMAGWKSIYFSKFTLLNRSGKFSVRYRIETNLIKLLESEN